MNKCTDLTVTAYGYTCWKKTTEIHRLAIRIFYSIYHVISKVIEIKPNTSFLRSSIQSGKFYQNKMQLTFQVFPLIIFSCKIDYTDVASDPHNKMCRL